MHPFHIKNTKYTIRRVYDRIHVMFQNRLLTMMVTHIYIVHEKIKNCRSNEDMIQEKTYKNLYADKNNLCCLKMAIIIYITSPT